VLNALLKHTSSNVLPTSSFPVPEGSSHVQTRHLWSPIDRGKSATTSVLIKRGALKGVPVTLRAPEDFQCTICLTANAQSASSNPGKDQAISIKGSRFHADFLSPKICSVRGYVAILLIIWKLMIHLSRTLTPDFVPLVAVPRLEEEMGDDRLYVYRHMVTVSSGLASSRLRSSRRSS
jgi:hypothetical protein